MYLSILYRLWDIIVPQCCVLCSAWVIFDFALYFIKCAQRISFLRPRILRIPITVKGSEVVAWCVRVSRLFGGEWGAQIARTRWECSRWHSWSLNWNLLILKHPLWPCYLLQLRIRLNVGIFPNSVFFYYFIINKIDKNELIQFDCGVFLHPYLLIYLLTPWSRVLLEKLTGFAANQEIPSILWNPKVHYPTHKSPPPVPILNQLHSAPTTPSHFLKIHLNIVIPSTSWSPQWSLSLRFPHQNLVHFSPFLHTCHMSRPSHSSLFYHPHYIGWAVQIIKLLIM